MSAGGDEAAGTPEVSVIMPVRNEADAIEATLDAVLAQEFDSTYEVVVAVGASSDETRRLLERRAAGDPRIRVVDNPHGGTPQGLNVALAAARGRYVVRVDGHSRVPRIFLQRLVDHLRSGRSEAAGGLIRGDARTRFGEAVALANDSPFGVGNAKHHYSSRLEFVDHVPFGAYVTERVRAVGGWDETFVRNQDFELDYRYAVAGGRILLDPSVVSEWRIRETPVALARQYFGYGYWRCRSLARHPKSFRPRWLVAPALVGALVGGTLGARTATGRCVLGLSGGSYACFLAFASRQLAAKSPSARARDVATALATMQLAYGSGFLVSAVKFAARARRAPAPTTPMSPRRS